MFNFRSWGKVGQFSIAVDSCESRQVSLLLIRHRRCQVFVDLAGQPGEEGLHRGGAARSCSTGAAMVRVLRRFPDILQRHVEQAVLAEVGQSSGVKQGWVKGTLLNIPLPGNCQSRGLTLMTSQG